MSRAGARYRLTDQAPSVVEDDPHPPGISLKLSGGSDSVLGSHPEVDTFRLGATFSGHRFSQLANRRGIMKRILLIVGATLGFAIVLGLLYVADDDRAMGSRRRLLRVSSDPSVRETVASSTKNAVRSVADAATTAIGQKVEEAAQHLSAPVHNAAAVLMMAELPEHIRIGISHFEEIPTVLAPVVFEESGVAKEATSFSFRTSVRSGPEDESVTVEANASSLEAAWEKFQVVMSDRITEVAVADAETETEAEQHSPER
jgi:hypothetical protein